MLVIRCSVWPQASWTTRVGVFAVQGDALDQAYLRRWAGALGVADLLDRALAEAQDDQRDSR